MLPYITKMYNRVLSKGYINLALNKIRYCQNKSINSEKVLQDILAKKFTQASTIKVEDISGGCGAMYEIYVESNDFKGLSIVKQHQAVCDVLKEQIKQFHGVRIHTKVPK